MRAMHGLGNLARALDNLLSQFDITQTFIKQRLAINCEIFPAWCYLDRRCEPRVRITFGKGASFR